MQADLETPSQPAGHPSGFANGSIYLLRTAQQHHTHLSSMADTKANIMIGVSALIFSILMGYLQSRDLTLSVGILCVTTLVAATLAILAVKGPAPGSKDFNPLFFGCFCQLSPSEYWAEMERILKDSQSVHTAMAMDVYGIGMVLYRRKYRYLAYSYRVFVGGMTLTFLAAVLMP